MVCYHNCLLDQHRTVLTHVLEDLVCCIASCHAGRFAGNCQGINQSLWMMFTNVYEKVMNESAYQGTWSVNSGYQLRDHLQQHNTLIHVEKVHQILVHNRKVSTIIQIYLKPCINFNCTNSLYNGIIHFWPLTIVKPKCQQPKCILQ